MKDYEIGNIFWSESKQAFICRVNLPNGDMKEFSSKDKKRLKRKLTDFIQQKEDGFTFEEMADAYEAANAQKVEDKTAQSYAPHIRRAKAYFKGRLIKDITPDEVQAYIDHVAELNMAKDTVHRALVVINRIFKYAIVKPGSGMTYNPCAAVEIPRGLSKTRREPPEEAQIKKVDPSTEMGLFAYFMMYSGLRNSELLALRWEDIDRENKVIHVRKAATYGSNKAQIRNSTKTEAGNRDVPLIQPLEAVLPEGREGYVFGGKEPLTHTMFHKRWLQFCRSVGLAEAEVIEKKGKNGRIYKTTKWKPTVTAYQFRHEYASLLQDSGVSEFDAKTAMGHSSVSVTKDIYTHLRERKNKSGLADKMNSYISGDKVE